MRPAASTASRQSLAFSVDGGRSWTPYAGNPVLPNPGLKDFRDPKLRWLPARRRWTMALACGDHIRFYSSPDLKAWTEDSRFGAGIGAHGGVWECPDLFPLPGPDGRVHWVLLVSITPGGPNGGSATQYFIGDFDGHRFVPHDKRVRWLDFGPDNYAGVTWAEVDDRALFIGWMSNWQYADKVPTAPWRSAMTMPRELVLRAAADGLRVASVPAREDGDAVPAGHAAAGRSRAGTRRRWTCRRGWPVRRVASCWRWRPPPLRSFTLSLGNAAGDELQIGFDSAAGQWWIDRARSGDVGFQDRLRPSGRGPRDGDVASAPRRHLGGSVRRRRLRPDGAAAVVRRHSVGGTRASSPTAACRC